MKLANRLLPVLVILFAVAFFPSQAGAQVTWGGSNGNWNAGTNWIGGNAPGSGTNAIINSGTANLPTSVTGASAGLTVGNSGTGVLAVSGGDLTNTTTIIGNNAGSSGSVTNSGSWSAGTTTIGNNAGSSGSVVSSGTWTTGAATLGNSAGSNGSVTVSSGTWTIGTSSLVVGASGTGSLLVNGGDVSAPANSNVYFGENSTTGNGSLTVSSGTFSDSGGFVMVGNSGTGSATVDGGYATTGWWFLGNQAAGNGLLTVSSGTLVSTDPIAIGNSGTGTLQMSGGTVTALEVYIGSGSGSVGSMTMTGGTMTLGSSFTTFVGQSGSGSLLVNGGVITGTSDSVLNIGGAGGNGGGIGSMTVSSGTVQLSDISVGYSGTGTLTVNGGFVSAPTLDMGGKASTINVSSGTLSTSTLNMGLGTINLSNSGVINITGATSGLGGVLNIGTGGAPGTLSAPNFTNDDDAVGTINFNFTGTFNFASNLQEVGGYFNINQMNSGTTIISGSTEADTTTISAGTLTVNGIMYDVATNVNGGVLNGSGTIGNVTVNNGGLFKGTLTSELVTVNSGGTLAPGNSPGANSMETLSMSGSATYHAQIAVPISGSFSGAGAFPLAGMDYSQTTLTGTGPLSLQTVLTLATGSVLELTVTGTLPAGGIASLAHPYSPTGSNNTLDNYFIFTPTISTYITSGSFTEVTADGSNFLSINYSAGNLVGNANFGTFTLDGQEWVISYTGNEAANSTTGGHDVALTAIPEPESLALLACGAILAFLPFRRKFRVGKN